MPIRTGYERILAHRTDDLYATTAKQDGKVLSIDDTHVKIEYKDGSIKAVELGRRFGVAAGLTIPHSLVSDVKVGQELKKGDVVAYNDQFFCRDTLDSTQVLFKFGVLAKTVLWQSTDTFEDSSAISTALAAKLTTQSTKKRIIKVEFDQEIRNLVKMGQMVDVESILCTIEDPSAGNSELFDDDSLETLKLLSNKTPRAKLTGKVEKFEVLYTGDIEDMSPSLRALATASDKARSSLNLKMGKQRITGLVESGFRIDGNSLEADSMAIIVYITGDVPAGVGDKGVFGNQLKTTFGRVFTGENRTASGTIYDAIFGYKSINNRIVTSATLSGTTNTLLRIIGEKAVAAYRSK